MERGGAEHARAVRPGERAPYAGRERADGARGRRDLLVRRSAHGVDRVRSGHDARRLRARPRVWRDHARDVQPHAGRGPRHGGATGARALSCSGRGRAHGMAVPAAWRRRRGRRARGARGVRRRLSRRPGGGGPSSPQYHIPGAARPGHRRLRTERAGLVRLRQAVREPRQWSAACKRGARHPVLRRVPDGESDRRPEARRHHGRVVRWLHGDGRAGRLSDTLYGGCRPVRRRELRDLLQEHRAVDGGDLHGRIRGPGDRGGSPAPALPAQPRRPCDRANARPARRERHERAGGGGRAGGLLAQAARRPGRVRALPGRGTRVAEDGQPGALDGGDRAVV